MDPSFKTVTRNDINSALEEVLFAELVETLRARQPGHCMKITNLDVDLMYSLCKRLKQSFPNYLLHILTADEPTEDPLRITSTKVVELRNPLPDGSLRQPLLVFIPNDIRTSSEDSFGIATFEEKSVLLTFKLLHDNLMNELPTLNRNLVQEIFLQIDRYRWRWGDTVAQIKYLLTLRMNGVEDEEITGAALFELGLVPDLKLVENGSLSIGRLTRNLQCLNTLTFSQKSERVRVLDLGLADAHFQVDLSQFLMEQGLENPFSWTREIVTRGDRDRKFWFDRWIFNDGGVVPQQVCIEIDELVLPYVEQGTMDHKLQSLVGQQVLTIGPRGQNKLTIVFRSTPAPSQLEGLDRFELQILSKEGVPVGITKQKKPPLTSQHVFRVNFPRLNKTEWSEGWYYIRVTAYTKNGDPFPLIDKEGNPLPYTFRNFQESIVKRPNESDLFYVIPGDEIEVEPPQRAIPRHASLIHAATYLRFSALIAGRNPDDIKPSQVEWFKDSENRGLQQNEIAQAKFGREGLVNIPISSLLHSLEQKILNSPKDPLRWFLKMSEGVLSEISQSRFDWPKTEGISEFLEVRSKFFSLLRTKHENAIIESVFLEDVRNSSVEYVSSYSQLLRNLLREAEMAEPSEIQNYLNELQRLSVIDSVNLIITDHRGNRRTAVLAGPTHPLRALWLSTWEIVSTNWLQEAKKSEKEYISPTRDALLRGLSLLNYPAVLAHDRGQLLIGIDNIHPFWTVFGVPWEEDPRGLIGQICTALGLQEPTIGGFFIDGTYLADRVRRYVIQHPYVDILTINIFNGGRGRIIADMLLSLQSHSDLTELKYNIRLFVADPDIPEMGQDLEDLLVPGNQATAQEADAFSSVTGNHLFPKLNLALRSIDDFRNSPSDYSSHITMLFDAFPAQEISAEPSQQESEASPVYGMYQDFSIIYSDSTEEIGWRRSPRHGVAKSLEGSEELSDLLSKTAALLSNVSATVATGLVGPKMLPVIRLALTPSDKALLHQVHEISDWVFIVDRNMGIEYFDHDGSCNRPEYLIDHSPKIGTSGGRRMVITSRSLAEVEALLNTVLQEYSLQIDNNRSSAVLTQLRSLSGRLALKLVSSPNARSEALGLALARMYLDYQGALRNQIIVPLDAHLDLYQVLQKDYDEIGNEVSLKRTDLALFDLIAATGEIVCNLIEVKCYSQVGDINSYHRLMDDIATQIHQTEEVLRYHFDPRYRQTDRPDRLIKNQEFTSLIEFYLDRAIRFGIVSPEVWNEAKSMLRNIEKGYRLNFTRSAIIFDFAKNGAEVIVEQDGIEYHRIGADLIKDLLSALPSSESSNISITSGEENIKQSSFTLSNETATKLQSTIPKLHKAFFLSKERTHTASWPSLGSFGIMTIESGPKQGIQSEKPESPKEEDIPHMEQPAHQNTTEAEVISKGTNQPEEPQDIVIGPRPTEPIVDTGKQVNCDILLGDTTQSLQFGILGKVAGRSIGLDLNHPQTISLFGVQGGGKSYTLGSIVEMATMAIPNINSVTSPLASVIFHFSTTQDYKPEFTTMIEPNADINALRILKEEYGSQPRALKDIVLLTPADKLEQRKNEFPRLNVQPLRFQSAELGASHWRFLMGAVGNQSTYIRQLNQLMRQQRSNLSLESLRQGIQDLALPDHIKHLANMRLDLAASYIDDSVRLSDILKPGRMVVVDLRDEFIEKDEALGLFVVLLQLFADTKYEGRNFNKLVVFDEAHKYIESPDLVDGLVEVVREMRHKGTSILVASQDPPSVPISLIELSTQIIMHRFNSPAWLKHVQKANSALGNLSAEQMANLTTGEAYIWSAKSTDQSFSRSAVKVTCRPRVSKHGGESRTAI